MDPIHDQIVIVTSDRHDGAFYHALLLEQADAGEVRLCCKSLHGRLVQTLHLPLAQLAVDSD